jgi:hypothetical protein
MEDDLNLRKWKTTSIIQEMEDNLNNSGNGRRPPFSGYKRRPQLFYKTFFLTIVGRQPQFFRKWKMISISGYGRGVQFSGY